MYYGLVHRGGSHTNLDTHLIDWTIEPRDALNNWLTKKFDSAVAAMTAVGIQSILPKEYETWPAGGGHDRTLATGIGTNPPASGRDATTKIPSYTPGSGNLEKALDELAPSATAG